MPSVRFATCDGWRWAARDATVAVLSPREREVGQLVASGHSNDEVAQILHISLRTVEKHVSRRSKMNFARAATRALCRGSRAKARERIIRGPLFKA